MAIPTGGHSDWLGGLLSFIPRKFTAKEGPPPNKVIYSDNFTHDGNTHPDVPNKGAWALSFAPDDIQEGGISFATVCQFAGGWWLLAIGSFRYDYVDKYYTFPRLAIKKVR